MTKPSLPSKMWAAQVISFNEPYKVHEIPVPSELAPHDLLVKVAVASLCHTDFMVSSGAMGTPLPCTGSHEGAGTVVATGTSVTQFAVGDRVMAGILRTTRISMSAVLPEYWWFPWYNDPWILRSVREDRCAPNGQGTE
ncbi:hypothetical protein J4E86_011287 [Alternaria arbusti]|uniref:uncharacterized protein n=1 Tax=Alternaria arbusti TaxID=232088 RepID=UPI00221F0D82|nr:uncharacterized protein J4E86_011287 [Alternaria arbusti]KAI4936670.1 hypothetical protein J4E86_011287 [Alternaria arbusti]